MNARTVQDVIDRYGTDAEARLAPRFAATGVNYPPRAVTLIGLKDERMLELWARDGNDWHLIHRYPVQAASGVAGPKLHEGDLQVPEGLYRIIALNPNSRYHLSMKLDYPNAFDRHHADREGRTEPGSDIFIHGRAASVGCLAMGDPAIEELFVLVAVMGRQHVKVILAPHDPKRRPLLPVADHLPGWTATLYRAIEAAMADYSAP